MKGKQDHSLLSILSLPPSLLPSFSLLYNNSRNAASQGAKARVKPAYAKQPTGYHKHNLYAAEIATGTVQRSEYMKAFDGSGLQNKSTTKKAKEAKNTSSKAAAAAAATTAAGVATGVPSGSQAGIGGPAERAVALARKLRKREAREREEKRRAGAPWLVNPRYA